MTGKGSVRIRPTIPVRITTSAGQAISLQVPAIGTADKYTTILGAGKVLYIQWYVNSVNARNNLQPRIRVDDVNAMPAHSPFTTWYDYLVELSKTGLFWGKYDTVNNRYTFICVLPLEFKRKLEIGAYNMGGAPYTVEVGYSTVKVI